MTRRLRLIAASVVAAMAVATLSVLPLSASAAHADTGSGDPVISLDRTVAPQTLYGTAVAVTLTATWVSGSNGYNLSFTDVIPAGASWSGGTAPTQTIAQTDGTTLLVFGNESDLLTGTTSAISYTYSYLTSGPGAIADGTTLPGTAHAYLSNVPRTVPAFAPGTGAVSNTTGQAQSASSTQLVPYTVAKALLGAPENEMLRGVHDHKYVYEITITNNTATPTTGTSLVDWLPSDLEFLGCTDQDNGSGTEPGSNERIDGPGVAPFPTLAHSCTPGGVTPVATTVQTDPDGASGRLPSAVYTQVTWSGIGTLAPGQTVVVDYAAAVPLQENAFPFSGNATANLDNNTGGLTYDEEPVVGYAAVSATNASTPYTVGAYATATAEDVAIQKTVSTPTITQGGTSTWTLNLESSEYTLSTGTITVTDTVPSGLDVNAGSVSGGGTAAVQADNTTLVTWNLSGYTAPDSTTTLTYSTTTRTQYRGTTNPVSARDSWTNNVQLAAVATVRSASGGSQPENVTDASAATQTAAPITIDKKVLPAPGTTSTTCAGVDPASSTFVDDASTGTPYHPGDTVCWLLTVSFPGNLNTIGTSIQDVLPPGFVYEAWHPTAANTVTSSGPSSSDAGVGTVESWTVSDSTTNSAAGQKFQVVVASQIASTSAASPAGTVQGNLMKVLYRNSAGAAFQLRDAANVAVSEPQLTPTKTATTASASAGQQVGFTVNVVNSGTQDTSARVDDRLPTGFHCADITTAPAASPAWTCTDASPSVISWPAVAVPASSTASLTYTATMPAGVAAGDSFTNTATVPSWVSTTNTGGTQTYAPTPSPTSSATVKVPSASVTVVASPAGPRIGDSVTFTVTGTVPANTTLYGTPTLTDTVPSNYAVTSATYSFPTGTSATSFTSSGNTATLALAGTGSGAQYANTTSAAQTATITLTATLKDQPGNVRGTAIPDSATLTWTGTSDTATRTATGTAFTTVVEPAITLTKTDDQQNKANPGATVTYFLTAGNASGTSDAYDSSIVDIVPSQMTPILNTDGTVATTGGASGTWDPSAHTVTFTLGTIPKGTSTRISFHGQLANPLVSNGTVVNNATLTGTSMPGTPSTGVERTYTATASDTMNNPQIALTKTTDVATATPGQRVTYTLTAVVPTDTTAYDTTLEDLLPAHLSFEGMTGASCSVSGSATGVACPVPTVLGTPSSSEVDFYIGDLPTASVTRTITITYTGIVGTAAVRGEAMRNTATLYFDQTDQVDDSAPTKRSSYDLTGNSAVATVTEVEPLLAIAKSVSGGITGAGTAASPMRATPGTVLHYTVTVTNTGTSPAYGATVTDTLPSLTPCSTVTNAGTGTCANGVLTWTVASPLSNAAGSNVQAFTYDVTVPSTLTSKNENVNGPELVNTAAIAPSYYGLDAPTRAADDAAGIGYRAYSGGSAQADVELDLASISGIVWEDWPGAGSTVGGTPDPTDPRLGGVQVTVTYLGKDGAPGGGDDEVHTTTTGPDGSWTVPHLPGGAYTVTVAQPAGLVPSWDADGIATPNAWATTASTLLGENEDRTGVSFSYAGTGTVGNTVWFDQNRDGIQQSTEPGLPNVPVTITSTATDPQGVPLTASVKTNAAGGYSFGSLPAGTYTVAVSPPTSYAFASDPDADGTAHPNGASTIALPAGGTNDAQDFGLAGVYSLGDTIWQDRNGNGTQQTGVQGTPDEPGLPNVRVTATFQPPGGSGTGTFTTRTDANGHYTLPNLPSGGYTVAVDPTTLPVGATPTYDVVDGTTSPRSTIPVSIQSASRTDVDFGYSATQSLGGTVWWDASGDHVPGHGPGLAGVTLDIDYYGPDGTAGTADDILYTATTDSTGAWALPNVSQGKYSVVVDASTVPTGFAATYDTDGTTSNGLGTTYVTVTATGALPQDFGYAGTGSIGDLVFLDRDENGVQASTATEPGLQGVPVTLTTTTSTGQTLTLTTTSGPTGGYSFTGLPAAIYTDAVTVPSGFRAVSDLDGGTDRSTTQVPLTAGQHRTDADFGLDGTASLAGAVFNDRDGDGTQESGEPGLAGVTLTASRPPTNGIGALTLTWTTPAGGAWAFPHLPPGTWTVTVASGTIPPGYTQVSQSDGAPTGSITTVLAAGQAASGQTFGYRGSGTISGIVYLDQNGSHSALNQPAVPGQTVTLAWSGPSGNSQTWSTTTGPDGSYRFDSLGYGAFTITVSGGIVTTAANTGNPSRRTDSTSSVTLSASAPSNSAQDFGYAAPTAQGSNSIGDTVWWDRNGNGIRDPGEPGIGGVKVIAHWFGPDGVSGGGDDVTLTRTTDPTGAYSFTGLPNGIYVVTVDSGVYPGLVPSVDTADTSGAPDGSSTIDVENGTAVTDADFGYVGTGSLGDRVWLDENGDGVRDPGEPGIPDVTIAVTWYGPDGVAGGGDDVAFSATTGTDGAWLVPRLPAGNFGIAVSGYPTGTTDTGIPTGGQPNASFPVLAAGQALLDQDFGYHGSSSVGDTVFLDADHDGLQGANEPGVPGVAVTVVSAGADGILGDADDITVERTTDAQGHYTAAGLPAGATRVSYDPTTLPAGLVPSAGPDSASATVAQLALAVAADRTDLDFSAVGTGRVSGVVYGDRNGDGVRQPSEPGVGGVGVVVTWNGPNGPVAIPTRTAADGSWSVGSLPTGSFTVALDPATLPSGYHASVATSPTVALTPGGTAFVALGITTRGLASTGLDALRLAGAALSLLVLGGVLLALRRRARFAR